MLVSRAHLDFPKVKRYNSAPLKVPGPSYTHVLGICILSSHCLHIFINLYFLRASPFLTRHALGTHHSYLYEFV